MEHLNLEDGIFSLVITLCQSKAPEIGLTAAKEEVATYLDEISLALRTVGEDTDARLQKLR